MNIDDLSEERVGEATTIAGVIDILGMSYLLMLSKQENFIAGVALGLSIGRGDIPNPVKRAASSLPTD